MNGLIAGFPYNGVVTVNRVILKPEYTVDDLQERVALHCVKVRLASLLTICPFRHTHPETLSTATSGLSRFALSPSISTPGIM